MGEVSLYCFFYSSQSRHPSKPILPINQSTIFHSLHFTALGEFWIALDLYLVFVGIRGFLKSEMDESAYRARFSRSVSKLIVPAPAPYMINVLIRVFF